MTTGQRLPTPVGAGLAIEQMAIDELRPDPANPRRISEPELESLTRSIREFGLVDPVLVRREDGMVIGGHQRLVAARRLGLKMVPVVRLDLSLERARLLNVALNKISGEFDEELLAQLLADLGAVDGIDLTLSGFGDDELTTLLDSLDHRDRRERPEEFDLESALSDLERTQPRTKPGDLWVIGRHRLLCGDSTEAATYDRLMAGERASLLATDPPYLVDYTDGRGRGARSRRLRQQGDADWDHFTDAASALEFFTSFLQAALPHCVDRVAVYQWHARRRQALVEAAWTAAGLLVHQQVIWTKRQPVFGRSHFMWGHEPCFYGWPVGRPPLRKPPSGVSTVWEVEDFGEHMGIHPTQKPAELFTRPMEYHTPRGDICLEPFLGSGTQLIAAERTGRRCFAVERDPRYVDIAMMRWEAFSGMRAVLEPSVPDAR